MPKYETYTLKARLTFIEELLGTASNNPDLHGEFIASKAPDARTVEEEIEIIGAAAYAEKQMTVFPRTEDGIPFLFDYQIKGFFKDSCAALRKVPGSAASKIKAFKKEIDGLIFVAPRMLILNMPGELTECQRSLRAATPKGEITAIACSEAAPAGTTVDIEIECFTKDLYDLVKELLDYGIYRGIGQWRNSGKGRFTWAEI